MFKAIPSLSTLFIYDFIKILTKGITISRKKGWYSRLKLGLNCSRFYYFIYKTGVEVGEVEINSIIIIINTAPTTFLSEVIGCK